MFIDMYEVQTFRSSYELCWRYILKFSTFASSINRDVETLKFDKE